MVKLEDLTKELGGQKRIAQIAGDLGLKLKSAYEDNDPELTKIRGHKPQEVEPKKKKGDQIEDRKGQLAQANTDLTKAALRSGVQLGEKVGKLKVRSTVQAMLTTEAKGLSEIAETIGDYSDLTLEGMGDLEEDFDIDELLEGEEISPLSSSKSPLLIKG